MNWPRLAFDVVTQLLAVAFATTAVTYWGLWPKWVCVLMVMTALRFNSMTWAAR
jgi:hypothetical protein